MENFCRILTQFHTFERLRGIDANGDLYKSVNGKHQRIVVYGYGQPCAFYLR